MRVLIDYSDGRYTMMPAELSGQDKTYKSMVSLDISDDMWALYDAYLQQNAVWHEILRKLDNENYSRYDYK